MGFSLIAVTAIVGVSLLVAVGTLLESTIPTINNLNDSFDKMRDRAIDKTKTNINITSVSTQANGTSYDINITVENTGSVTLETADFDILINGTKNDFTCSRSYLHPENEVYFNVSSLSGSGQRRLKVVTNNGISDYYEFSLS